MRVLVTAEGAQNVDREREVIMLEQEATETKKRMEDFNLNSLQSLKSWKDSGVVEELKVITSGRPSVCKFCASQKDKIISITDAQVGENVPPFKKCQNFNTKGCCCGFRPIVDLNIKG